MDYLYLADPLDRLRPQGDSTLALVRATLRRGDRAYWCLAPSIEYRRGDVLVSASQVLDCPEGQLPRLSGDVEKDLTAFRCVFIRKDPPFDTSYLRLCWVLSLVESKVAFLNRPSLLIRYHEKLMALEALSQGFITEEQTLPTLIGEPANLLPTIRKLGWEKIVSKPFLGFGGQGVRLWSRDEFASACRLEEESVFQPFFDEVRNVGDRRVFFLDGRHIGDFVRMPPAGGFVSNLAQGGRAVARPLDAREVDTIERIGKFLKSTGVHLAGADLIGPRVSEINITSPTGIQAIKQLEKRDISDSILDFTATLRA